MATGYDGRIRIKYDIDTKDANSQILKAANEVKKIESEIAKIRKRMDELARQDVPTKKFQELQQELSKAEKRVESLKAKLNVMEKAGDTASKRYNKLIVETSQAYQQANRLMDAVSSMRESGEAFVPGQMTEEYSKSAQKVEELNDKLRVSKKHLAELVEKQEDTKTGFSRMGKACSKFGAIFAKDIKKSNNGLKRFGDRLKSIMLSLLVFNWISKGFNAMLSAMKDGYQNLAKYSTEYNANMSKLKSGLAQTKNALAAAFEPIVNMAIPYLAQLVNWMNRAIDTIGQFLAALSGKNTYTRAKKQVLDYAKSLDTAQKSAKRALAAFDELNIINKNDSDSVSAGGELTGADAFETAPISKETFAMLEKAKTLLQEILPWVKLIGLAFLAWKIADILDDLGLVDGKLKTIFGVMALIAGLAIAIPNYFDMWENGVDWEGIKGYIIGIGLAIAGLYVLFGPFVAGLALIAAGAAGVVLAFKDMCDNGITVENVFLAVASALMIVLGVFLAFGGMAALVVAGIMLVVGAIAAMVIWAGNGEEALQNLKEMFGHLGDFVKNVFVGDWDAAFNSLVLSGRNAINLCNIAIESFVSCMIDAVNTVIDAFNSIFSYDVPPDIPIIGGKTIGPSIPTIPDSWKFKAPRLADGAVIRGGDPFLAWLGDQPKGQTNIETPMQTMVDAFKQAMAEGNSGTGGSYTFIAQLNGRTLFKETVRQEQMNYKSTGKSVYVH